MSSKGKKTKRGTFLSYYAPYRGILAADLLCAAAAAAAALVLPMCVRHITGTLLSGRPPYDTGAIWGMGALMLALIAAQTCFTLFYDYKGHDMGAKIERDMRLELFAHYQRLPLRFYDGHLTGSLLSRLTGDLLNLAELYHHGPENIVVYGAELIGSLVILLAVNPKLTLAACAILPVMAAYSLIFNMKLRKSYRKTRERIAEVNAQAEDSLSGIRVVKSFAAENAETGKFSLRNDEFYQSRKNIYKQEALHYDVMHVFLTQLITVVIVVLGGVWIAGSSLTLSDLLAFILYSAYLTAPIPKLAFMVQQYQDGFSAYRRFREIMETTPEEKDGAPALRGVRGHVEFAGVTFRYSEEHDYVLRGITLEAQPGQTVAIVGGSGVGKTTLCSLLPRFYEIETGSIRIDGVDVRDVSLSSLRGSIGVVQQENFLFAGTVMENILYGRPGAGAEEAVEAAKRAGAHEFILGLPNGYDTWIGQRGVKLSGGQRQRVSIARAFLKDPPILILDEATSALDYESERAVLQSLKELSRGRTTFVIAHRLSTVRGADAIVVLYGDGIAERGTHGELMAQGGLYAKMYGFLE